MQIELNYTLTVDDVHQHLRVVNPRIRPGTFKWFLIIGVAIVLFVISQVALRSDPAAGTSRPATSPPTASDIAVSLIPYLLLFVIIWVIFLRNFPKSTARILVKYNPHLVQPCRVILTDESINLYQPNASHSMLWTHFNRIAESDKLFVLMISKKVGTILPKRAFPSPAALDEFRAFAQAHISNTPVGFPVQPD